ncbi:hypothetical protein SAMN05216226_102164 [Halovenus aranensis]|uniref:Uncharacterized protein n=1 Tax=Halovenus aranensis TaxID=890420 RepID=A0A1G8SVA5_9EURY|nr:hypothetical protein [Halovenus aranensis]SDJ33166.1 hypothetical protein SAMN05216226_102164 [Halovenus aranensis]
MTRTHRRLAFIIAALTVVSSVAVLAVAGSSVVTLDDDTGLSDQSTIEQFDEEGLVQVNHVSPKMTFTVAEQSSDVGVDGIQYTDFDTIYLKLSHEESIERTVRIHIPEGYWHPHPDEIDAIDSDLTMSMEPTGDGASAVEVHFEGRESGVFQIKKQASLVFHAREYTQSWLSNQTGIDLPSLAPESDGWEYVPMTELSREEPTFGIRPDGDSLTLQYDAANSSDPNGKEWRPLPSCDSLTGGDAPVCSFEQEADSETVVYVMTQVENPPDVRFKAEGGFLAQLRASLDEAIFDIPKEAVESARDWVDDLLS